MCTLSYFGKEGGYRIEATDTLVVSSIRHSNSRMEIMKR
jgi:hypothetical protein